MDTVTFELKDFSQSPWGLFTEEFPPQPFVWLTEISPTAEIYRSSLSQRDIENIWLAQSLGVISTEGLFIEEDLKAKEQVDNTQANIFDVAELMRKENQSSAKKKHFLDNKYPGLDTLLALPAPKLKKELKQMAKTAAVSFFQEARKREETGKGRKTVLAVLLDIIQKKVEALGLAKSVNSMTGESMVSDIYYESIEEFSDEDKEEVEIKVPFVKPSKQEVPEEIAQRFAERAQYPAS